jgi:cytosine/adenosine deaminase-related metal-dependent hydrolase
VTDVRDVEGGTVLTGGAGTTDLTALTGGTVVELDPPRVSRCEVILRGDRIAEVLPAGTEPPEGALRVDARGCVVTPAFVVGHTHLYSALACGMPPPAATPQTFRQILERVWWRLDRALDDELVELSALAGAIEAARRGAACVIDHHASPNAIDGSLDRVAEALDRVGVRGVLCYETSDRDGRTARDAGLRENERFIARTRASGGASATTPHRGLVGAHALFTLEDDTLDALRDLADRTGAGLHVHVAEDGTDGADALARRTTLRARVERLGLMRPRSVVGHAVHLDDETRAALAEAGAWIATNARSNMNNAVGLARASGPRVALGTDGIGADMIAEAQAHFFRHAEAGDGLAGDAVARLVGAQRLAAELFEARGPTALASSSSPSPSPDLAPRIRAGARADLAILAYDPPTPMTAENVAGHVLFGWSSACVRDTVAGGRFILRDRVSRGVAEHRGGAAAGVAAARLWDRMASTAHP